MSSEPLKYVIAQVLHEGKKPTKQDKEIMIPLQPFLFFNIS